MEGLYDKVGYNATIIRPHIRAVSVENTDDTNIDLVFAVVVEKEGFGDALAFVVASSDTDGVDVSTVALGLGVNVGVAVDFRGGGLENAGFDTFGEAEAVDRPHHRRLCRLDRVILIVNGGSWAGEVEDPVDFDFEGVDDIVAHELEVVVVEEVVDVAAAAGEEVIHADDFVSIVQEAFTEV